LSFRKGNQPWPSAIDTLAHFSAASLQLFFANLLLTAVIVVIAHKTYDQARGVNAADLRVATLAAIPVIVVIAVVGRYMARETDEFVRMMVVQALLWGLGVTFVAIHFSAAKSASRKPCARWRRPLPMFVVSFFKKPHIFLLLVFIFLYRAGEGQVIKVGEGVAGTAVSSRPALGRRPGPHFPASRRIYGVFGSAAFILAAFWADTSSPGWA